MELVRPVYQGEALKVEFFITELGHVPAEEWLDTLPLSVQEKFAALFAWIGDHGKIWNERKFKHLTGTDQIFEFKIEANRVLCFFFFGKRIILTHGFRKKGDKAPKKEIQKAEEYKKNFERRIKQNEKQ